MRGNLQLREKGPQRRVLRSLMCSKRGYDAVFRAAAVSLCWRALDADSARQHVCYLLNHKPRVYVLTTRITSSPKTGCHLPCVLVHHSHGDRSR